MSTPIATLMGQLRAVIGAVEDLPANGIQGKVSYDGSLPLPSDAGNSRVFVLVETGFSGGVQLNLGEANNQPHRIIGNISIESWVVDGQDDTIQQLTKLCDVFMDALRPVMQTSSGVRLQMLSPFPGASIQEDGWRKQAVVASFFADYIPAQS